MRIEPDEEVARKLREAESAHMNRVDLFKLRDDLRTARNSWKACRASGACSAGAQCCSKHTYTWVVEHAEAWARVGLGLL